jgi:Tfp pilus assembly protein PilO
MKPSKLPKEKRNQLILISLVTLVVLAGLGFGLIKYQYESLAGLAAKKTAAEQKLVQMQEQIKRADQIEAQLAEAMTTITNLEAGMAPAGDSYSWVINTVRGFKGAYKVEIPQFSPISHPTDVNMLAKFPYKQVTLTVAGTAHYHDLGKFLADFENEFPHIRLVNLDLSQSPAAGEAEKLVFKVDIVTLVKPNPS